MESKHKCIVICCAIVCMAILAGFTIYAMQEKQKAAFRMGFIHKSEIVDNWVKK